MDKKRLVVIKNNFDSVIQNYNDDGSSIEFWYARDLMSLLGYERWENFFQSDFTSNGFLRN